MEPRQINLRRTRVPLTARYLAAQEFARLAGERARGFFAQRDALDVEHKGAQNFVSHADRAVEGLIAAKLAAAFPSDAFYGEESAASMTGTLDRVWVVDPIDGTHNFLRGARYYCVSIAYVVQGQREIGVVCDPEHDEV
ncbi:MAG: inositol monophosphatase, partial [Betaproteobacteria bacterium]